MDRDNLTLLKNQNDYISKVAKVNKNVIVVVHAPGAVLMPWASSV
jgi:hypothetical protein